MKKCCLPKALPSLEKGRTTFGHQDVAPLQKFVSRDIAGTNPLNEQFSPTESDLLPQQQKMAGMSG